MITNFAAFNVEMENYLKAKANAHNVSNINAYFLLNANLPNCIKPNTLECVFYHFALEGQDDGRMKTATINMGKNEPIIRNILFDYDYLKVLNNYKDEYDLYCAIDNALPKLNHKGTNYRLYPRYQYACTLWDACNALSHYKDYSDFKTDVLKHVNTLPEYIISGIPSSGNRKGIKGLGYPLGCNILKEIDQNFDMAKPDLHIKKFLEATGEITIANKEPDDSKAAIDAMRRICNGINSSPNNNISVFQLDRILWLICTETFFLDDNVPNRGDAKRNGFIKYMQSKSLI